MLFNLYLLLKLYFSEHNMPKANDIDLFYTQMSDNEGSPVNSPVRKRYSNYLSFRGAYTVKL